MARRFYFHFSDLHRDVLERDWCGKEYETTEEALAYAHAMARGLSSHPKLKGSMLIVSLENGIRIETIQV